MFWNWLFYVFTWGGVGKGGWHRGRARSFEKISQKSQILQDAKYFIEMYTIVFVHHLYNLIIIRVSSEDQRGDVRGEVSRVGRDRLPAPRLTLLAKTNNNIIINNSKTPPSPPVRTRTPWMRSHPKLQEHDHHHLFKASRPKEDGGDAKAPHHHQQRCHQHHRQQ